MTQAKVAKVGEGPSAKWLILLGEGLAKVVAKVAKVYV